MSKPIHPLPIWSPVLATLTALLDLGACFFMASGSASIGLMSAMILVELFLIALAIFAWVHYARNYIDRRIQEQLDRPQREEA